MSPSFSYLTTSQVTNTVNFFTDFQVNGDTSSSEVENYFEFKCSDTLPLPYECENVSKLLEFLHDRRFVFFPDFSENQRYKEAREDEQ
jgi:hypothetical protein